MSNETEARLIIDDLLRESGWILVGEGKNVRVETKTKKYDGNLGSADYTLFDDKGFKQKRVY